MSRVIIGETFLGPLSSNDGDNAALAFGPGDSGSVIRNCTIDGRAGSWGLKLSHVFNLTFEDCVIKGGAERALDIVRGGAITFTNCRFERGDFRTTTRTPWSTRKTCDIGIKGGARDITFDSCVMNDLLLGDYSIYNQRDCPITRRINLCNCSNANPWDIVVRGIYSERVSTYRTNVKEMRLWPVFTSLYFFYCKRFGDTRKLNPDEIVPTAEDLV